MSSTQEAIFIRPCNLPSARQVAFFAQSLIGNIITDICNVPSTKVLGGSNPWGENGMQHLCPALYVTVVIGYECKWCPDWCQHACTRQL